MPTVVFRLCGQDSTGPSGVRDQSVSLATWPQIPPPERKWRVTLRRIDRKAPRGRRDRGKQSQAWRRRHAQRQDASGSTWPSGRKGAQSERPANRESAGKARKGARRARSQRCPNLDAAAHRENDRERLQALLFLRTGAFSELESTLSFAPVLSDFASRASRRKRS